MFYYYTKNEINNSGDRSMIDEIIESGNSVDLMRLILNPHLTDEDLLNISRISQQMAIEVLAIKSLSPYVLERFYQASNEHLRVLALCHVNTSVEDFTEAVVNGKYSYSGTEWSFTSLGKFLFDEFHLFKSYEAFEYLWTNVTQSKKRLIGAIEQAGYSGEYIDPRFANLVSSSIQVENIATRSAYAAARYVSNPVTLDSMRTDYKKSVINYLASNPTVFVSTHDYLLSHRSSSTIKRNIAVSSSDNSLLNRIYHGTKSESIKGDVKRNKHFHEFPEA